MFQTSPQSPTPVDCHTPSTSNTRSSTYPKLTPLASPPRKPEDLSQAELANLILFHFYKASASLSSTSSWICENIKTKIDGALALLADRDKGGKGSKGAKGPLNKFSQKILSEFDCLISVQDLFCNDLQNNAEAIDKYLAAIPKLFSDLAVPVSSTALSDIVQRIGPPMPPTKRFRSDHLPSVAYEELRTANLSAYRAQLAPTPPSSMTVPSSSSPLPGELGFPTEEEPIVNVDLPEDYIKTETVTSLFKSLPALERLVDLPYSPQPLQIDEKPPGVDRMEECPFSVCSPSDAIPCPSFAKDKSHETPTISQHSTVPCSNLESHSITSHPHGLTSSSSGANPPPYCTNKPTYTSVTTKTPSKNLSPNPSSSSFEVIELPSTPSPKLEAAHALLSLASSIPPPPITADSTPTDCNMTPPPEAEQNTSTSSIPRPPATHVVNPYPSGGPYPTSRPIDPHILQQRGINPFYFSQFPPFTGFPPPPPYHSFLPPYYPRIPVPPRHPAYYPPSMGPTPFASPLPPPYHFHGQNIGPRPPFIPPITHPSFLAQPPPNLRGMMSNTTLNRPPSHLHTIPPFAPSAASGANPNNASSTTTSTPVNPTSSSTSSSNPSSSVTPLLPPPSTSPTSLSALSHIFPVLGEILPPKSIAIRHAYKDKFRCLAPLIPPPKPITLPRAAASPPRSCPELITEPVVAPSDPYGIPNPSTVPLCEQLLIKYRTEPPPKKECRVIVQRSSDHINKGGPAVQAYLETVTTHYLRVADAQVIQFYAHRNLLTLKTFDSKGPVLVIEYLPDSHLSVHVDHIDTCNKQMLFTNVSPVVYCN